jgi:hypothetical protein
LNRIKICFKLKGTTVIFKFRFSSIDTCLERSSILVNVLFLIGIVGGGVQLGPLDTAPLIGLLCQPRVITMMEKLVE